MFVFRSEGCVLLTRWGKEESFPGSRKVGSRALGWEETGPEVQCLWSRESRDRKHRGSWGEWGPCSCQGLVLQTIHAQECWHSLKSHANSQREVSFFFFLTETNSLMNLYVLITQMKELSTFCFFFFFWPCCMACGILVPWPRIEPEPPAVEVQSPNHWTTREVHFCLSFFINTPSVF